MEKGQQFEFTIEDISSEGNGIGRAEGMVVFVQGALPGDRVLAEITKVKKNYAIARPADIIEKSEHRITDEYCRFSRSCGGCPYGALKYDKQLKLKENQVKNKLARMGGVDFAQTALRSIVSCDIPDNCDTPCGYRNKAVMAISTGGLITRKGGVREPVHEPRIGFRPAKSHEVIDCDECMLQTGTAMAAAEATRRFMEEDNICSYDSRWDLGLMKSMTVRTASGTGEVMVIYDINGKGIPNAAKLIEYLDDAVYEAGGSLESVVIRNNRKTETLAGKPTITDAVMIGERTLEFEISANSFYQVNHSQMQKLYGLVRKYVERIRNAGCECSSDRDSGSGERKPVILDLYCGIGTIGLCVADLAEHVYGIETVRDAVTDANRNATINGIVNATYTCGKAEELIGELTEKAGADIAVLDPPRAGCRLELLEVIAEAGIPNVIYISCDPATLARDIAVLRGKGYEALEVTPVDMFPQTGHCEVVSVLEKI